eukprot:g12927.t1
MNLARRRHHPAVGIEEALSERQGPGHMKPPGLQLQLKFGPAVGCVTKAEHEEGPRCTALSLERGIAGKLKRERLKVDEDLFDQLNELAAKGHVSSAREIFEQLMAYAEQDEEGRKRRGPTKEVPTTMVYNTMLKASANAGDVEGANEMAALMRAEGLFMNEKFYGKMMEAAAKAGPFLSTKSCQLLCFGLL